MTRIVTGHASLFVRMDPPHDFRFPYCRCGFAGSVLAERLASQLSKTCLVVERRNHVGGNAYDHYDRAGVLLHDYGPHYFRTNSQRIVDYLSQFTVCTQ
jgi:UDP-galactopyranose mutase